MRRTERAASGSVSQTGGGRGKMIGSRRSYEIALCIKGSQARGRETNICYSAERAVSISSSRSFFRPCLFRLPSRPYAFFRPVLACLSFAVYKPALLLIPPSLIPGFALLPSFFSFSSSTLHVCCFLSIGLTQCLLPSPSHHPKTHLPTCALPLNRRSTSRNGTMQQ